MNMTKFLKLSILAVAALMVFLTGCEKKNQGGTPEPPVVSNPIEKQWLLPNEVTIDITVKGIRAKSLIDVSVTKPGHIIFAYQNPALASLLGIPGDMYWYTTSYECSIEKKDDESGVIKYSKSNEHGQLENLTIEYSNLSSKSVKLVDRGETLYAESVADKMELASVNFSEVEFPLEGKQWLVHQEIDIDFLGIPVKAKILLDISLTASQKIILAMQQPAVASLLQIPPDAYFYDAAYSYTITKKDKKSGTIKFTFDSQETVVEYSELTYNRVLFRGIEETTMSAEPSENTLKLYKVNSGKSHLKFK